MVFSHVPVHFVCCYIEQKNKWAADLSLYKLKHLISSIFSRTPSSRVIVMGDFNNRREEVDQFLRSKGIIPILDPNIPTHNLGGQLDQVFSNMSC